MTAHTRPACRSGRVVVAGGGPAAHRLVERLRAHGHRGAITVLGSEPHRAYNRVLLGNVLDGSLTAKTVLLPELDAQVRFGATVTGIDRAARTVSTADGSVVGYDTLVLATGSRPRLPELPGLDETNLLALRTLEDCARIDAVTGPIAVLGGGVLGVETARALLARGGRVSLVHPGEYLMPRQLDRVGAALLAERLGKLGTELHLGASVTGHHNGALVLSDGQRVPAELVVACTGIRPETALAEAAGLTVEHGVVVDHLLRTSDPSVHAIGDCAEYDGQCPGLVSAAWDQAETLAAILTGGGGHYHGTPAVTRLKARGVELVSLGSVAALEAADTEVVTLSDPARGRYARLALRSGRVSGAVLVGFPEAIAALSQLHDRGLPLPADRLALLLGTPAAVPGAPAELPEDAVLCRCNNVTKKSLTAAWQRGARSVSDLARATRATTGCGGCLDDVAALHRMLADRIDQEKEGAA